MATKRSVILKGSPVINEDGAASEAIKPGYLVKGAYPGSTAVAKQTATTGFFVALVALERDELGRGIDDTYQGRVAGAAAYASGDKVKVAAPKAGEEYTMYVASGQNISADDLLQSAGDGTLAEGSTRPIAQALETLGAVTVETALRVRFI